MKTPLYIILANQVKQFEKALKTIKNPKQKKLVLEAIKDTEKYIKEDIFKEATKDYLFCNKSKRVIKWV